MTTRRLTLIGLVTLLTLGVLFATYEDDPTILPIDSTNPVAPTGQTIPTVEHEIVSRLRDILRIREEAYRLRSPEHLRSIYSSDCPCLMNDERAIKELLDRNYRWRGIATSIEVSRVTRINNQLWIVVAVLKSKVLRIERDDGRLIRIEPAGNDLFRFALVRPRGAEQWLLGLVSNVGVQR